LNYIPKTPGESEVKWKKTKGIWKELIRAEDNISRQSELKFVRGLPKDDTQRRMAG
jgi:hypothetical protein